MPGNVLPIHKLKALIDASSSAPVPDWLQNINDRPDSSSAPVPGWLQNINDSPDSHQHHISSTMVKKEFTFRGGKLGFDVKDKANTVMVTKVTNEEYLDRGIFPGCQLLSVNDSPVTDRKSLVELLRQLQ